MFITTFIIALIRYTTAFTNGTLLPAYLCGMPNDGFPKTLGGVLALTVYDYNKAIAFNANPASNLQMNPATMSGGLPPNTAFMMASFHNRLNAVDALVNVITVNSGTILTPGQPFPLVLDSGDANTPLDGCMIFAQDANGNRIGSFIDAGQSFSPFPACGTDNLGNFFGMVHNKVISDTNQYTQLMWMPPATLMPGQVITIKGLAVTDVGFGTHETTFTVGAAGGTPVGTVAAGGGAAKKVAGLQPNLVLKHVVNKWKK